MEYKAGIYRARVVKGQESFGESTNGHPEMILVCDVKLSEQEVKRLSTSLIFSQAAASFSWERLRAAGMKGDDLTKLEGIDANEVDFEISYDAFEGKTRMKTQILTGGGQFKSAKPMDAASFAAKVKALTGSAPATSGAPAGTKPPF